MKAFISLLKTEWILDYRNQFSMGGTVLYALIVSFLCLLTLNSPSVAVWNLLFWLMVFFINVIASGSLFQREGRTNRLFYYQVISPEVLYLAKLAFQMMQGCVLSLLVYFCMVALSYDPVVETFDFFILLVLGNLAIGAILTFTSALSNLVDGSGVLLSVMSLPTLLPIFLLLVYQGGVCMDIQSGSSFEEYLTYLGAIALIAISAGYLLIQHIWRN